MPEPLLEFDPTSEDAANSPLSVWNTASYGMTAFNPDAANQAVQWASSIDTEGALPASSKDENRTITMTIECLSAAALRALQAKVTKISRERGTLKYTLPNSEVVIFDLLARESFKPEFDDKYFVNSGAYCTVSLGFTALPYGRGTQQSLTLSSSTATAGAPLVFTATGVKGDVPARGSLQIGNVTNSKTTAFWGVQSRYYSSAASAALFFQAETTEVSGASVASPGSAGASGGGANKVRRHSDVGTTSTYSMPVTESTVTSYITHVGSFRVIVRAQALSGNTGTVSLQLGWFPYIFATQVENDWVPIETSGGAAIKGSWVLADLGTVTIPRSRAGLQAWIARINAKSTVATDDVDLDWVMFVPVDEGSGRIDDPSGRIYAGGLVEIAHDTTQLRDSTALFWYDPEKYEGDYLFIPPAGAENRTVRFIVLLAGATGGGNRTDTIIDAVNLDAITATVNYTPRYLVVPSP